MNAGITEVVLGAERKDYIQLKYKKTPQMLDWKNIDKKKARRQYNEKIQR